MTFNFMNKNKDQLQPEFVDLFNGSKNPGETWLAAAAVCMCQ